MQNFKNLSRNQLAKLDSQIKLQSQIKPFQFSESRNSTRKCFSRSWSTPHLNISDNESEVESLDCNQFKATPFPKNLFCNYFQYKMWENNYFR
jgi:protein FAM161A